MGTRQLFSRLKKRGTTMLFWANSARYGFCLVPRLARDVDEHSMILDARWLCFGVNVAFVDEDQVSRGFGFDAVRPKASDAARG